MANHRKSRKSKRKSRKRKSEYQKFVAKCGPIEDLFNFKKCNFNTDSISLVHEIKSKEQQFGECLIFGFCRPFCFLEDQAKYLKVQ